jgi:hypothetical protein
MRIAYFRWNAGSFAVVLLPERRRNDGECAVRVEMVGNSGIVTETSDALDLEDNGGRLFRVVCYRAGLRSGSIPRRLSLALGAEAGNGILVGAVSVVGSANGHIDDAEEDGAAVIQ